MNSFELKEVEIRILISLAVAGLLLFLLIFTKRKSPSTNNQSRSKTTYRPDGSIDPKTKKKGNVCILKGWGPVAESTK